jgi:tetratricopeptide (TPR) repeat protein
MAQNNLAKESHEKALSLYLENQYPPAKKLLLENITLFPDYSPSHMLLGQIHFFSRKPNYEEALKAFREVVRINPSWEEGHHWSGIALEQIGDIDKAIVSYSEAIRLTPEDSRPHVALGNCYMKKGSYNKAITMFRQGLELKPYCTEADVRGFLAKALMKNSQIKEACAEWQRVLKIEAGYPSNDAPLKEAKRMLAKYCNES